MSASPESNSNSTPNDRVTQVRRERTKDDPIDARDNAHVQKQHIEFSERTLSVIALVLSVAAFVLAIEANRNGDRNLAASNREVDKLVRETKQLQIQVMDHNALLIREGFLRPADETYGPAGNIEYRPREKR